MKAPLAWVPAELREHLRGSAAEQVKVLEQIADNPKTTPRDRMQAIDLLFRYGLGPVTSHDVTVDHERRTTIPDPQFHAW